MSECKQQKNELDMLNGSIWKNVMIFALPLALSSILQQLFNSADVAVVGRFSGSAALAAVGSNGPVIALFVNIFVGLSVGPNVIIANYIGQGKNNRVSKVVHTVISFGIFSGIFLLLIGQVIAKPVLILIGTPENVLNLAVLYLRIYFLGMPFIILYNFSSAILRSIGDTKRPMFCLIFSGVLNVLLNVLLVVGFHLGVAGVAIATVLSNVASCFILLYLLVKENSIIHLEPRRLKIEYPYLMRVIKVGAPASVQTAVFSLSNVIIQSGINSFGADAIAGSATGLNFEYFTYYVISAFAQACVTFTSQNFGAGKMQRCRKTYLACMVEGMVITAILSAIFIIWGYPFCRLYTHDESVIRFALNRMNHVVLLEAMTGIYEITGGSLRGSGYSALPAVLTVLGSVCFRILWMFTVFNRWHDFDMLMTVYPVSWLVTGALVVTAYIIVNKRRGL